MTNKVTPYAKRLVHITIDGTSGDEARVNLPVEAVRRLLAAADSLPIPDGKVSGDDMKSLLKNISTCLDEEAEGEIINIETADDRRIRVLVD